MIAITNVGDDRHVALIDAESLPQDAAARRLEDSRRDQRIQQDVFRAAWTGTIALIDDSPVDRHPVAAGCPNVMSRRLQDRRDHPRAGCLAVRPRDRDNRYPTVVFRIRKQRRQNGFPNRPRLSGTRLQVHQQSGTSIDFDDHASLFFQRASDVFHDEIQSGDI